MILAVDGNHLLRTYYHITPNADPDDIVERFLTRLDRLRDLFMAKARGEDLFCFIAFDNGEKGFRHQLLPPSGEYPGYKGARTHDPIVEVAISHAEDAIALSQTWHGLLAPRGYEADDVLSSIAAQTEDKVVLHSADKDLHQCLVDGRVVIVKKSMVNEEKRTLEVDYFSSRCLKKKFAIPPTRWVDYQCLVGDVADSVPGASGFGPVAAMSILRHLEPDQTLEELEIGTMPLNKRQIETWPKFVAEGLPVLRKVLSLVPTLTVPVAPPATVGRY